MTKAAILDIDGTLVDTNYHHTLAWYRAFRTKDLNVPLWRIHRHMGMGGDKLIESLTDADTDAEYGDEIRDAEKKYYGELIDEVAPMDGARDLIVLLKERGTTVILASSAKEEEVEHYLDLLDVRDLVDGFTHSGDVEETKPHPELVEAALDKVGDAEAYMVGDSTWDCIAAEKAGVKTIALLTGGFSKEELTEAGAAAVFESVRELVERIDETPLV